jgi:hypothetical protein
MSGRATPGQRIALRLGAAILALAAGIVAVVVVVQFAQQVLG